MLGARGHSCYSSLSAQLKGLLIHLLEKEHKSSAKPEELAEFIHTEFGKMDKNNSGEVDFDEFVAYYNQFMSHLHYNFGGHKHAGDHKIEGMTVEETLQTLHDDEEQMKDAVQSALHAGEVLHEDEEKLAEACKDVAVENSEIHQFLREMAGDWELLKHEKNWIDAVQGFARDAFGLDDNGVKVTPQVTMLEAASFLPARMDQSEPSMPPSTAVLLWHPSAKGLLKVYEADTHSELKAGENVRPLKDGKPSAKPWENDIWEVMNKGEAILRNKHGVADEAATARSVFPLVDAGGRVFGAVVSGPPALPDGLLERVQPTCGHLFERLWRVEQVAKVVKMAESLILSKTRDQHKLIYSKWTVGAKLSWVGQAWDWQPLMHSPPGNDKKFQLELRWADKQQEPIGVWSIDLSLMTAMDEAMIADLHSLAPIVQSCVHDIEKSHVGDPTPFESTGSLESEFDHSRLLLPFKLQQEVRDQIKILGVDTIFNEIHSFASPPEDVQAIVRGVLALLGHRRKDIKTWIEMKKLMTTKVAEEMLELDMCDDKEVLHKNWEESQQCTAKVLSGDPNEAAAGLPAPVKILLKWLQTTRMVHHIALADHGHDEHTTLKKKKSGKHVDKKKSGKHLTGAPAPAPAHA